MKKYFFFLFFLVSLSVFGQSKTDSLKNNNSRLGFQKYNVGVSPSAFLNYFPGIQISQDFGINKYLNIPFETAYIYKSVYAPFADGFRIKSGIEWCISPREKAFAIIGIHGIFRRTFEENLLIENNFNAGFRRKYYIDRTRTLTGGAIVLGCVVKIVDRLYLNFTGGIGGGTLVVTQKGVPDEIDVLEERQIWGFAGPVETYIPVITVNLNFSYNLIYKPIKKRII